MCALPWRAHQLALLDMASRAAPQMGSGQHVQHSFHPGNRAREYEQKEAEIVPSQSHYVECFPVNQCIIHWVLFRLVGFGLLRKYLQSKLPELQAGRVPSACNMSICYLPLFFFLMLIPTALQLQPFSNADPRVCPMYLRSSYSRLALHQIQSGHE